MSSQKFIIRPMSVTDLELVLSWAAAEGWNPGLDDAPVFFSADPGGFLIGEVDGEPISSISAVRYDNTFGFIGFYIVKPGWRGQGFGLQTWNAGLKLLGDRNCALDGVLAQVDNYRKFGFQPVYSHIRYEGVGIAATIGDDVVLLKDVPFVDIVQYDSQHFPVSRSTFLQGWISSPRLGYGFVEDGRLRGYGVIRQSHSGYRIGPLFADNVQIAETLLQSLKSLAPGQSICLDIPNTNPEAISLAQRYNMKPGFECMRMYTHQVPDINIKQNFGVTTLELG